MTWYKDGSRFTEKMLREGSLPTLLPKNLQDTHFINVGAKRLVVQERPVYNPETHNASSQIELINGVPTKTWTVEARPQEEIDAKLAAQAVQAKHAEDEGAVKTDNKVRALLRARPAQIDAYIENNVSNLADAKATLATLAKAVALLMQGRLD